MEHAHYQLDGLLRTMRSDLMEKTDVNMNVKSLLAPWLANVVSKKENMLGIG